MTQSVNMGDKVNGVTAVSAAATLTHAQTIVTGDGTIATNETFTFTSALIDAYTIPVVSVWGQTGETATFTANVLIVTPTIDTLNSQGEAAVITPGTVTVKITASAASAHAPMIGVNLL